MSLQLDIFRNSLHLQLTIKNIGKAPAYNVEFEIDDKYKDIFRFNFSNKISYFAPEQCIESFGKPFKEFWEMDVSSIPIKVKYTAKDNSIFIDTFNLDWSHFEGVLLSNSPYDKIERSLEKISKSLDNIDKKSRDKANQIVPRIRIIEIQVTKFYFSCLFNDGFFDKIELVNLDYLKISNIEKIRLFSGDLYEESTNLTFTAEEIYSKFKNRKKIKYKL